MGECELRRNEFVIRLRPNMGMELSTIVLLHEWAHALTMEYLSPYEDDHCDRFWTTFGRLEKLWGESGHDASRLLLF